MLTTLLITIIPVTTSNALTLTGVYGKNDGPGGSELYSGVYGDTLKIFGSDVTSGYIVNVYWDVVGNWNGENGLLNSTIADSSGSFEVWLDIPEVINGDHNLWLEDTDSNDVLLITPPIDVDARLRLLPSAGAPGDEITIEGYGYAPNIDVVVIERSRDAGLPVYVPEA